MYALVDCNNFYASCERVFQPHLVGKPVVVLSNNDGCVIARSNEAKALDIPMGAPAFKHKELFRRNNVHVFSSNYVLYGDMSHRVMSILSEEAPDLEIYSIDEAFLSFNQCPYLDLATHCLAIKERVEKATGIPVSIGIAPTKTLAKVANRIAKKFPKQTNGVHSIDTEEKQTKALKWLKVEDIWGIGRRLGKRLQSRGINTAYQFTSLDDEWLRKKMSVVEVRLKRELLGEPILALERKSSKKSIATTRSFDTPYTKLEELSERVSTFAVSCAEKLRRQHSHCNTIMVFILTSPHRKDLPQYYKNIVVQLPFPTHSTIELAHFATKGLKKIFKSGYHYKKAGVIATNFSPETTPQLTLFDEPNPRHNSLMKVIDDTNKRVGHHKVKLGSQAMDRIWKMRQEQLSPRYTTQLSEIIKVNA